MKVWSYDIWEGDKGIIFAKTEKAAEIIFGKNYRELVDDGGDYQINLIGEYTGGEDIMYLWD